MPKGFKNGVRQTLEYSKGVGFKQKTTVRWYGYWLFSRAKPSADWKISTYSFPCEEISNILTKFGPVL